MSPKYLFVSPPDASSSRRERELQQADVRRHAATVSHSRKPRPASRSQQTSGRRSRRLNPQGQVRPPTADIASRRSSNDPNTTVAVWYSETQCRLQPLLCGASDEPDYDEDPEATAALIEGIINVALRTGLTAGGLPLPMSPVKPEYSANFYRAIEYYTRVLMPNNTAVYAIFDVSNVNCFRFLEIIAKSRSPYAMHSALALLHLVIGEVAPTTNSYRHALQHTGAAMALLRRTIDERGDQSNDAAFVSVICLAAFARAIGDHDAYRIHRERLAVMIQTRGGLLNTGFQGFVRALTLQFAPPNYIPLSLCFTQPSKWMPTEDFDFTDPFFHDSRPFKPDRPQKIPPDHELALTVGWLPKGLQSLIQQPALSMNTIQLLCRIANAHSDYASPKEREKAKLQPPRDWHSAQYIDFWECCPSISRAGPDLEKYLCLALLLYTANEFAPNRAYHKGIALYSGPRAVLTSEIGLLSSVQLSEAERECWIWIWWVVIDSWSEGDKLSKTGTLLTGQFWTAFPDLQGWTGLRSVLQRFFWGGKFKAAVERLVDAAPTPPLVATDNESTEEGVR